MTITELRQVIADATAALDAAVAVEEARTAAREALGRYAKAAGLSDVQAWRAIAPEGATMTDPEPEAITAPEWVQPQAHNPCSKGDRVSFKGAVYESTVDGNVWSPAAYPQGWKKL